MNIGHHHHHDSDDDPARAAAPPAAGASTVARAAVRGRRDAFKFKFRRATPTVGASHGESGVVTSLMVIPSHPDGGPSVSRFPADRWGPIFVV